MSMHIKPTHFVAWAAGFFDGEGCVGIARRVRGNFIEHLVGVQIGQNTRAALDAICARFGGSICKSRTPSGCYRWRAHGGTAERFLRAIRPYLFVKGDEADCALEVRKYVGVPGARSKPGHWDKKEEIWKRFRAIKDAQKCHGTF